MKKEFLRKIVAVVAGVTIITAGMTVMAENEETWGYNWDFSTEDTTVLPADFIKSTDSYGNETTFGYGEGKDGSANSSFYVAARYAKNSGELELDRNAPGMEILTNTFAENMPNDCEVVVSTDFKLDIDNVTAAVISPAFYENKSMDLSVVVDYDGNLVVWGTHPNGIVKTGKKIVAGKWYTVAAKYELSSDCGHSVEVYLNGEYLGKWYNQYRTESIAAFRYKAMSKIKDGWYDVVGQRPNNRAERLRVDNLYIGNDTTKIDYALGVANVEEHPANRNEITVHFNKAGARDVYFTDVDSSDFVNATDGSSFLLVTDAQWKDEKTVVLSLSGETVPGVKYEIMPGGETIYSFNSSLDYFWSFDTPGDFSENYITTNTNSGLSYNEASSYKLVTDDNSCKLGKSKSSLPAIELTEETLIKDFYGMRILDSDALAANNTKVRVNFDIYVGAGATACWNIHYNNSNAAAASVMLSPSADAGKQDISISTGTTYNKSNIIGTIDAAKWYNLGVDVYFIEGTTGKAVIDAVYIDGVKMNTTPVVCEIPAKNVYNRFTILTNGVKGVNVLVDNMYIGGGEYSGSAFSAEITDNNDIFVNSGMTANECNVILALYSQDTMVLKDVVIKAVDLNVAESNRITASLRGYEEGDEIKLFVWDADLNKLAPYEAKNVIFFAE